MAGEIKVRAIGGGTLTPSQVQEQITHVGYLLRDTGDELRKIATNHGDQTEYLSCRRSLLHAIGDLQEVMLSHPKGEFSPVSYFIDLRNAVVRTKMCGSVGEAELIAYATALKRNPQFRFSLNELVSFEADMKLELRLPLVDSERIDPFSATSKRAYLVPSPNFVQVASLLASTVADRSQRAKVFKTREDALDWLL